MDKSADYYLGKIEAIIEVTDSNIKAVGENTENAMLLMKGGYEHINKIIKESGEKNERT